MERNLSSGKFGIPRVHACASENLWQDIGIEPTLHSNHGAAKSQTPQRTTPPTYVLLARLAAVTVIFVMFLRFVVLISEAHAILLSERSREDEMMLLCQSGAAPTSTHMRAACLGASRDRAGMVWVRAFIKATAAFTNDTLSFLSSPARAGAWAIALGVLSALPWLSPLRNMLYAITLSEREHPSAATEHRIVVLHHGAREGSLTQPYARNRSFEYDASNSSTVGNLIDLASDRQRVVNEHVGNNRRDFERSPPRMNYKKSV